ncbi:MAG: GatB/YqeY domain-containing protein [Candidatus Saganbacteria bacterium]|nr:GatB/YqeY domain-containing protein [Candidatus Saganbacteria bacterium]
MFERINKNMAAAMKAKDTVRLETLRMMKSKILNVNARGDLPEKDIARILQNYVKSLKESVEIMVQHGKTEDAGKVKTEIAIIEEYLPRMLTEEETKNLVKETISVLGATSIKEIGRVMKEITGKRSDVDGSLVKKLVSEILQ